MGKRVRVQRQEIPKLNVGKLREPQETSAKLFGVGVPLLIYAFILGGSLLVGGKRLEKVWMNGLTWLGLALFVLFVMAAASKRKLLKDYPRSRVTGSQHQDVRLALNRLCRLLDLKKPPETYIVDSERAAATVRGLIGPHLIISSRILQILTPQEFEAILASLLGHVKGKTVFWRTFIHTLRETNGLLKMVCAPYLLMAQLLGAYLEFSHHTADRIALLLLDGDFRLLSRTILKVLAHTSDAISEEQCQQLDGFLAKTGVEASAADVEHQYILGVMVRHIPGLRERLDNITSAGELPAFQEQLEIMRQRVEMLQLPARG